MFRTWYCLISACLVVFVPIGLSQEPPQQVVEATEAVAEIQVVGCGLQSGMLEVAQATGVFLRKGGYLLTCGHLFWYNDDPSDLLELWEITITLRGEGWTRQWQLEDLASCEPNPAVDTERDIALLKLDEQLRHGLRFDEATVPSDVWLLGYADPPRVTSIPGIVRYVTENCIVIEVDTLPKPGMSGSPVLTREGKIVGIVIGITEEEFVLAVPAMTTRLLQKMMQCF